MNQPDDKFAIANGLRLAYQEFGNSQDDAVILIPRLATQLIAWPLEFCLGLADSGYRVIRFDQRDTGLSQKLDNLKTPNPLLYIWRSQMLIPQRTPYKLMDMTQDLIGMMDYLEIESAHLIGSSMGGMIAQLAASKHQHRVLTLTSMMSTSGAPMLPGPKPRMMLHLLRPGPSNVEGIIMRTAKSLKLASGGSKFRQSRSERLARARASYERSHYPAGAARQMIAIANSGSRVRALRKINSPTLVIHGSKDPMIPAIAARSTAKHIPDSSLAIVDQMGHDITPALVPTLLDLVIPHLSRRSIQTIAPQSNLDAERQYRPCLA